MMDQKRFWDIIESVKHKSDKPEAHCKALKLALVSLSNDELVEFQFIWDDLKFSDDYLHATLNHMSKKFYSDDGFWFGFIPWLIGQGQEFYTAVRKNPINIVSLIPEEKRGRSMQNEAFKHVGEDLWKARTGLDELPDRFNYEKNRTYGHVSPEFLKLAKIFKFNVESRAESDTRLTEYIIADELMQLLQIHGDNHPGFSIDLARKAIVRFRKTPSANGATKPNLDE